MFVFDGTLSSWFKGEEHHAKSHKRQTNGQETGGWATMDHTGSERLVSHTTTHVLGVVYEEKTMGYVASHEP